MKDANFRRGGSCRHKRDWKDGPFRVGRCHRLHSYIRDGYCSTIRDVDRRDGVHPDDSPHNKDDPIRDEDRDPIPSLPIRHKADTRPGPMSMRDPTSSSTTDPRPMTDPSSSSM